MKALVVCLLVSFSLWNVSLAQKSAREIKEVVVCIDAGHGGKDPGRLAGSSKYKNEKHIVLSIAKKIGNYIDNRIEGVSVIYTRKDDTFVSLEDRVEFANKKKVDFFLSIHCNSHNSSKIYGTQSHIHSHEFKASRSLALRIEQEFRTKGGRHSRGIRSARDRGQNLYVVQYTEMPAVLVEVGYLSNPAEERYLNSEWGQDLIASAVFRAFRSYLNETQPVGDRSIIYKVQLAASAKSISVNTKKFDALGLLVVEHETSGTLKYKYMVGREYDMKGASKLLKEVKKAGFKDAFIVKMTNKEAKKYKKLNKLGEKAH